MKKIIILLQILLIAYFAFANGTTEKCEDVIYPDYCNHYECEHPEFGHIVISVPDDFETFDNSMMYCYGKNLHKNWVGINGPDIFFGWYRSNGYEFDLGFDNIIVNIESVFDDELCVDINAGERFFDNIILKRTKVEEKEGPGYTTPVIRTNPEHDAWARQKVHLIEEIEYPEEFGSLTVTYDECLELLNKPVEVIRDRIKTIADVSMYMLAANMICYLFDNVDPGDTPIYTYDVNGRDCVLNSALCCCGSYAATAQYLLYGDYEYVGNVRSLDGGHHGKKATENGEHSYSWAYNRGKYLMFDFSAFWDIKNSDLESFQKRLVLLDDINDFAENLPYCYASNGNGIFDMIIIDAATEVFWPEGTNGNKEEVDIYYKVYPQEAQDCVKVLYRSPESTVDVLFDSSDPCQQYTNIHWRENIAPFQIELPTEVKTASSIKFVYKDYTFRQNGNKQEIAFSDKSYAFKTELDDYGTFALIIPKDLVTWNMTMIYFKGINKQNSYVGIYGEDIRFGWKQEKSNVFEFITDNIHITVLTIDAEKILVNLEIDGKQFNNIWLERYY